MLSNCRGLIYGSVYCNEVSSMKESHHREPGGGCGCQRREDVEKETVLADSLGTEVCRHG